MNNEFNSRFRKAQKRHNLIFRIATALIVMTFLLIVIWYAFFGTLVYQGVTDPTSAGSWIGRFLNSVNEQIK
ncbi:hypothetical protein Elgi_38470 [Paenibacillus elgii]|uniref:hypothetical protein n=1 Tax=Paenibacillus elgii TaxID=189691 RepID=UPI002D7B7105|nr:hypothetical protein Elgi_38470 [Paenibacillus elgii]